MRSISRPMMRAALLAASTLLTSCGDSSNPHGPWKAALDLAGGPLPFRIELGPDSSVVCNGPLCIPVTLTPGTADSLVIEIADYDARIVVRQDGDSLVGAYRNVGNRGPRVIPFRAARGRWPVRPAGDRLVGRWDAHFITEERKSPRVLEFRNGELGLEASYESNNGDYGLFAGAAIGDSLAVSHFDGSFVFLITAKLDGDSLRGIFHAGLRTQTPFVAWRSTGAQHLVTPTAMTRADTSRPFEFSFPDLEGNVVTNRDERFKNKVVLIDIFGTWCPTCHDAAPILVDLSRRYGPRGLEIIGIAYEVTGDSTVDNPLLRRFRDKFSIPYPLLRGGINVTEETAATLPQLKGFTAYPTTLFLGRDGKVKYVYAGFRGPAVPEQYRKQVAEYERLINELLAADSGR